MEFTPTDVVPTTRKIDADLRSITITIAEAKEQKGEVQVGFGGNVYEQSFKQAFKTALEEGLARSAIFSDLSSRKVSLAARVLRFQSPKMSARFKTEMIVRYEILDRNSGSVIYSNEVASTGEVSMNYAFLGAARWAEARNITVRQNVKNLIADLETNQF